MQLKLYPNDVFIEDTFLTEVSQIEIKFGNSEISLQSDFFLYSL